MIEYSTGTGSTVRVIDGIIINHGKKALIRTEELIEKHILNDWKIWGIDRRNPVGFLLLFIYE